MWSVKCGVESVKCGVWSVECEVWSGECKVWSVKCGMCGLCGVGVPWQSFVDANVFVRPIVNSINSDI